MGEYTQDTRQDMCLGRAMATEWRRMYPQNTAGNIAQDIQITKKAAENLLNGHFSSTSMGRIISAYGPGWVAERVLEAAGMNLEIYIANQVAAAEREAAEAKAKLHEARNRLDRYQTAVRGRARNDGADPGEGF